VAKHVSAKLACVVQLAHERAKVGGSDILSPSELRDTMVLRREEGTWKIVHPHGDPITIPQPAASVIQQ
jgi:ketosteroid isomerase-like protein